MHRISVTTTDTRTTLVVDGKLLLVTTNANIARAYADAAELHYATSSKPFVIEPVRPTLHE